MKTMYITNYKLYNYKTNDEFRMCLMSDLHFNSNTKNEKLSMILNILEKLKPIYTLIPGDIINGSNVYDGLSDKKRLLIFLKEIGEISKTIISLGNHDFSGIPKNNKDLLKQKLLLEFFEEIKSFTKTDLLNNSSFQDNKIFATGYTQINYYKEDEYNKKDIFNRIHENKYQKHQELKQLLEKMGNIPSDKLCFLMSHSPVYLNNYEFLNLLYNYDYFLSGHMHNGIVPACLNEIFDSSTGIITPSRHFFQKGTRNTLNNKGDKLIVNGAISTFHDGKGLLNKFNFLYPSCITILDFTKDEMYDSDKIYTKRYYK